MENGNSPSLIWQKKKLLNDLVLCQTNIQKSENAIKTIKLEDLPDGGEKMREVLKNHKKQLKNIATQLAEVEEKLEAENDESSEILPTKSKTKSKRPNRILDSSTSADSDKENGNGFPASKGTKTKQTSPVKSAHVRDERSDYRIQPESEAETESDDTESEAESISSAEVTPLAEQPEIYEISDDSDGNDQNNTSPQISPRKGKKVYNRIESDDEEDDDSYGYDSFANPLSILKGPVTENKSGTKYPLSSTAFFDGTEEAGHSSPGASETASRKSYSAKKVSPQSLKSPPESDNWQSVKSSPTESENFYSPEVVLDSSKTKTSGATLSVNKEKIKEENHVSPRASFSKAFSPRNEMKFPKPSTPAKPSASTAKTSPPVDLKSMKASIHAKMSSSSFKSPTNSERGFSDVSTFAIPDISSLNISPENNQFKSKNLNPSFHSQKTSPKDGLGSSFASSSGQQGPTDSEGFVKPQNVIKGKPIWETKMPSKGFNLNDMGKKALETHRIQQALTVDSLRTIHKSLETMPGETELLPDPKLLKSGVELMPHQRHALVWLLWREKQKPRGGILADDMGLGKTLTMISLILKNRELKEEQADGAGSSSKSEDDDKDAWASEGSRPKKYPGGTLVIAPATLLSQWEGEVKRRVKSHVLKVLVHHGNRRELKARRLARYDMVITTYGIVTSDGKNPEDSPLFKVGWERIIIDEAHQIRNPKTHSSVAVCLLTAKNRWALTGTPIHNKNLDMYGLLKFLRCKPFDDLAVWKRWVDNKDAAGTKRLNTVVKSILLRRTKDQVLSKGPSALPPKTYRKIEVEMDADEKQVYHQLLLLSGTMFAQYLNQRAEKAELNQYGVVINKKKNLDNLRNEEAFKDHPELANLFQKYTKTREVKTHEILVFILRLRQMCCHPSLISAMIDKEAISADGIEEDGIDLDFMDQFKRMSLSRNDTAKFEDDAEESSKVLSSSHPLFSPERVSSKVRKVVEVLEKDIIPSGDKCVIVSQWSGFLSILASVLKGKNIRCDTLSGAIPIPERGSIVDKFNDPYSRSKILLLSLTAGGCGLNLVGGNRLLLIDIHWNPQLENQACDRIYRVGQTKDVFIYRFIVSDTIEEAIEKLQIQKLNTADQILTGAKQIKNKQLSLDDIKILFGMDPMQPH